ncbi:Endonuclease G_ mitochondrial, partial [Caligus rogercresseyi]
QRRRSHAFLQNRRLRVPERNQTYDLESFVLPNQRIDDAVPLSSFYVPPDSVERASAYYSSIGSHESN